jgi:hypothetical protein
MAQIKAFRGPSRGLAAGAFLALVFALSGCRENLSRPTIITGADTTGPVIHFSPAQDTLADSTGILLVQLDASDESGIKQVDFFVLPALSSFGTLTPFDTSFSVFYSVPLATYKHGTIRFYARSLDLLNHETVTDTVTVTVK